MAAPSVCDIGLGKQIGGEGLIGLTRGFMYAGATRVVARLPKVDDLATAEIICRFYRGILKDSLELATGVAAGTDGNATAEAMSRSLLLGRFYDSRRLEVT